MRRPRSSGFRRPLIAALMVTTIAVLAVSALTEESIWAQDARVYAPTKTPIKHLIFLMQENHSFDNYFGTYPGADGIPPGTCMPVDPFSDETR